MERNETTVTNTTVRITTDVTAIKILDENEVVAGIGGTIHIFQADSNGNYKLVKFINIFYGQKVHGLILSEDTKKLIVHGGTKFVVLDIPDFNRAEEVKSLSHWIQAAHWLEDGSIAFALSNNSVSLWKDSQVAASVSCPIQCIIYSALLLGSNWQDLAVFSGTVFSEVLIWGTEGNVWHQLRGHKGVIFSITFDQKRQRILTSSDDRSVRVWQKAGESWSMCQITQIQELYGHQSRVWRALAADFGLVSIGEDSVLCQWDENGKELTKVCAHQGGSIWSAAVQGSLLVTGGGDGGVMAWKIGQKQHEAKECSLDVEVRRIACTNDGSLLVVSEEGKLFKQTPQDCFQEVPDATGQIIQVYKDLIFILSVKGVLTILKDSPDGPKLYVKGKVSDATVLSICVFNSSTFLISTVDGDRVFWSIKSGNLEKIGLYTMQTKSKGAYCGIVFNEHYLIGDQDGYLHVVSSSPALALLHTLNLKSEGITGLCTYKGHIYATCKEGKFANVALANGQLQVLNSGQPRLGMLAGLEVTSEGLLLYAFHKEHFTAWSWNQQRPVFRFNCPGGGHRPWSFNITLQNTLKFSYIRHKRAFFFESPLSNEIAPAIRIGLHLRLVNCMVPLDENTLLSGGEDGSLRIYEADSGSPITIVQAHLSSVKALLRSGSILISAGGRAQLIFWQIQKIDKIWVLKQLNNHMLLDGDKPVKSPWRDSYLNPRPDPETRYMSLSVLNHEGDTLIFLAACSDSLLRIFMCSENGKTVKIINTISHHNNCVLQVYSAVGLSVSGSSDGEISIWDSKALLTTDATPLWSEKVHQGGVTSLVISTESCIYSGGDDGTFRISQYQSGKCNTIFQSHSATQITGIEVFGNFALTSTSGQCIALWRKNDRNMWHQVSSYICTVADLQGITVIELQKSQVKLCIFGKGSEVLDISWDK